MKGIEEGFILLIRGYEEQLVLGDEVAHVRKHIGCGDLHFFVLKLASV